MKKLAATSAPAWWPLWLRCWGDPTCPPSTVFAAYNRYRGTKDTQVWPFADHGGGHGTERHTQLNRVKDQGLLPTRM
ncbi:acetylxylan esterase [Streptomyces sp. NBC_00250]|nr:acetylxylan esterase [Streptomyces sp. NBC_00250]